MILFLMMEQQIVWTVIRLQSYYASHCLRGCVCLIMIVHYDISRDNNEVAMVFHCLFPHYCRIWRVKLRTNKYLRQRIFPLPYFLCIIYLGRQFPPLEAIYNERICSLNRNYSFWEQIHFDYLFFPRRSETHIVCKSDVGIGNNP